MQLILSHNLSLTLCWTSPQPQHVWRNMFFHICIQSQTWSFDTREDAKIYMTVFFCDNFCNGTDFRSFCLKSFHLCCLVFLRMFLSLRQYWPSNLVRRKTIVLFVSDHRTSLLVLVRHDWNYMSLLLNTVHVPSTENTLSFLILGDCSSLHNFVLDSERSSSHQLLNMNFEDVFNRK